MTSVRFSTKQMESSLSLDQLDQVNPTLASALREKDNGELNIVTAEDPIEYDLGGNIQQSPVNRAKDQTFAQLLRRSFGRTQM